MSNKEKQLNVKSHTLLLYRLFCLVLIVCNIIIYVSNNNDKSKEYANTYPLIDPATKFISQEDYILNIQPLRDYLLDLEQRYPNNISVYYEQLNSGANISVNKYTRFYPASLNKLPFGILAMHLVETGKWTLDTELKVEEGDIDSGSGDLFQTAKVGDSYTVEFLLEKLLVDSDNTAHRIFVRNIGLDELGLYQSEVGLEDLFNDTGQISAKEYARILRSLYVSSFLQRENSEKILDLMSKSKFKDYLSQGLPSSIIFAHKFGENREQSIFSDAGIVYVEHKPYMLIVMLKGKDDTEDSRTWATNLMREISEHAYLNSK